MSRGIVLSIRSVNVPDYIPHKDRPTEIEELENYLQVNVKTLGDTGLVNIGSATPSPDVRNIPWFKLDVDGTPLGIYIYHNGQWVEAITVTEKEVDFDTYQPILIDTTYEAETPGILFGTVTDNDAGVSGVYVYVSPTKSDVDGELPGALMLTAGDLGGDDSKYVVPFSIPVKKGDFYRVAEQGTVITFMYWAPLVLNDVGGS